MRIYAEEIKGGTIQTGNAVLILDKKEAQNLVKVIDAVANLKPREVIDRNFRTLAKKLDREISEIPCF